jgi:ABC-2 type transport system permease protein
MHDLRLMITERAAFVARLVMPIAFIVVVGIANDAFQTEDPTPPVLAIVDKDDSLLSRFYSSYLVEHVQNARIITLESNAEQALDSGTADFAVVIPDNFGSTVASGSEVRVELVLAVSDPQQSLRLESLLDTANQRLQAVVLAGSLTTETMQTGDREQGVPAARARATELLMTDRITIETGEVSLPGRYELIGFQQSVPGMGSMFVMLGVLAGASLMIEDRRRFTLQRTMIAPVSRTAFVTGKILGRFVVGMMQYVVAILTGLVIGFVVDIHFGSSPMLILAVMASFTLAASSMSMLIAAFVRREQQASGLQTLLAVTLAPLGGAWWSLDIEIIPDIMRSIAYISPFYWVMEGFKAGIFDLGFRAALLPIAVLLALAFVLAALGSSIFRSE